MNKATLRKLLTSFRSRKCPEYAAFRQKILTECGIAYPTLGNYSSPNSTCKIPKLVAEKIIEIVHRDYPEKVSILNELQEA